MNGFPFAQVGNSPPLSLWPNCHPPLCSPIYGITIAGRAHHEGLRKQQDSTLYGQAATASRTPFATTRNGFFRSRKGVTENLHTADTRMKDINKRLNLPWPTPTTRTWPRRGPAWPGLRAVHPGARHPGQQDGRRHHPCPVLRPRRLFQPLRRRVPSHCVPVPASACSPGGEKVNDILLL